MEQSVKSVMENVSRELDSLASLTSSLQEQLSPRGYTGLDIKALQSLDSLTQTLTCLASFLSQIGSSVNCDCSVAVRDALSQICLSALAGRLQGDTDCHHAAQEESCELF